MCSNYLISLRKDAGGGKPGTQIGPATYIEIADDATSYNLNSKTDPKKWLGDLPGTSVLVFVHGYGNNADKVVDRHKSVRPHVPPGTCLVSFDWPSGNLLYSEDKQNALNSAPNLMSDCLQILLNRFTPQNVHLFCHSMGAYVTANAFQAQVPVKVNHLLMAAADVDRLDYGAKSTNLIHILGKCADLTVYWSTDDKALQESEKLPINKGAVPLGLQGYPGVAVPGRCYGIDCTGYFEKYVKPFPAPVPPSEMTHVWYLLYQPTPPPPALNDFYSDMAAVLQGAPTSPTRAATQDPNGFQLKRPGTGVEGQ